MDKATLAQFFLNCSCLSVGLMVFWALMLRLMPGWVYRRSTMIVSITREQFNLCTFGFFAAFKVCTIVLFLIPYVAIVMLGD